ncbi:linoleate 13S-lipoxygenase 2-1, chloroplastic-like isoform X2 [Asparagus officinalis]|uniref:linoleate 13S-lipoxygenase 2-1, chloroplastic-like isoform X2 n=1 Tax=Asparagus officinalis TaxID=4686 RepID=UPI00098E2D58|nr:linoleate 13S-lipoxygenase 2-1, chloroplastic-like isoform X2 [Asparagus officinalis]
MLTQFVPSPNNKTPSIVFQSSSSSSSRSLPLIKSLSVLQKSKRIRCASEAVDTKQVAAMSATPEAVEEQQVALSATKGDTTTVKAEVNVKMSTNISLTRGLDDIGDLLGRSVLLELVSAELDQETGDEKETIGAYAHKKKSQNKGEVKYEGEFSVPKDFGEIGAILVENAHHKEMYIKDIILMTGDETTALYFDCRSWVHSKFDNPEKRIFFTTKMYLPSETPSGLQKRRTKELETLRGDGTGERKCFERIYDYDTYNDLGDPNVEGRARPVVGGSKQLPYPRRCRTGRPKTKKDPLSEERKSNVYVPRDEAFSEVKQKTFSAKTLRSAFHALVPSIRLSITDKKIGFSKFNAIDKLFMEGLPLSTEEGVGDLFHAIMPRLVKTIAQGAEDVLRFETPAMIHRDKFSWFRDEEFARQTLAGLNPLSIQLVTELPFFSELDPEIYGPAESALTEQIIERQIKGDMTVKEALEQKKLFVLDYHDLLLPFVHKVRELEDTTLYGSRTVFFLTPEGTLRPVAIELTRPKSPTKPQWKRVFTHSWDSTGTWLWRHAKAHVCAHDAGFHQLYSHWLRTHCSTEPYVIALNRQLSVMHPIYQLLHPHFRYTLEINALAREYLISHGGIIETSFSPGKYAMELCSVAYGKLWRFDMEGLPADLLRRGMAVEDPSAEHGLRLTIEDYPYANDGLLIWSSIKKWVSDYVTRFYPTEAQIQQDSELQQWWTEIRSLGHADKQHEPWWPTLNSHSSLIEALSTIIWVTSGHHAAVNFGQYHFSGYFPNRPTVTRLNMPVEDLQSEEYEKFLQKPEATLLRCFPSQVQANPRVQATVVMSILDVLSNHSPDEEYLGETAEPAWARDEEINAAFERFHGRMKEIEGIIDGRNKDPELKNRCGAGICPYELLKPFSEPGVTGKGVPKSITI